MIQIPQKGERTLFLIDGSSYIYRAYHAIRSLSTRSGFPTNAIFGFANMLLKVLRDHQPTYTAMVLDAPGPTFRHEIYPEYKANRDPTPEELKRQFGWARAVAEALGLQCYADERYEADDLIGTLAVHWRERGHPICIVTADKDLAQLVGEQDHWWDFSRNQKLNAQQLSEKFGVAPGQMADYLALTGDAVDNIPGVPGIGPKSAAALLGHFEDLDDLYDRLDEVLSLPLRGAKSIHRRLVEHRPAAELARRLTSVETAVESALAAPELTRGRVDEERLNQLFDELSFGGMLRQRCLRL